jgi:hypothetical protein
MEKEGRDVLPVRRRQEMERQEGIHVVELFFVES